MQNFCQKIDKKRRKQNRDEQKWRKTAVKNKKQFNYLFVKRLKDKKKEGEVEWQREKENEKENEKVRVRKRVIEKEREKETEIE